MNIQKYILDVERIFKTGSATEHSYRSSLQSLFSGIDTGITALNEPKRVQCGAPDFMINRGIVTIGHAEAKDLGKDLSNLKGHDADQKERFLKGLSNLIYTNGLDFEFYRNGELYSSVSIAKFSSRITPDQSAFKSLENHLRDFASQRPQTITSSEKLAEIMAGKAALIKDVLTNTLRADNTHSSELHLQYAAFKEHLIHDINPEDFSDIYAETIAYGLFAARLHDATLDTFSRQEALDLLPKSNPFLRSLFTYIAGPDLDDRIRWIIDELAEVFQACDVKKLMANFGSLTQRNDPFLHFYETFLAKYNPEKRRARGVWYTPEPVVNFIARAVDDVIKSDFGLPLGLADSSKVILDWDTGQRGITKKGTIVKSGKNVVEKKEVHRVQILDPATGTGTFLAEVIKHIAPRVKQIAGGHWSRYIERDLIPRLHGFELLMASYAMCHMKLDMILTELGYIPSSIPPRISTFLTNSLEEGEPPNQTLPFAQWLSNEVRQANTIKRDMPIMCVIGNPPYSISSSNKGKWIQNLISVYKSGLNEKKINLDDDYIKFLRLAEHYIEKNGTGIVGFITNNSFLDGATHRAMRKHLLETFDKIYVFNLHGDVKKGGAGSDKDQNVFDIMQGVSISILVKTGKPREGLGTVSYRELYGTRKEKYDSLWNAHISDSEFSTIKTSAPYYFLVPRSGNLETEYMTGFKVSDFFINYSSGIQTKRDSICVNMSDSEMNGVTSDFRMLTVDALRDKYSLPADGRDWTIEGARSDVMNSKGQNITIQYRPFDFRKTYYTGKTKGFLAYPRREINQHFVGKDNIGLVVNRQTVKDEYSFVGISNVPICHGMFYLGNRGQDYLMPLYCFEEIDGSRRSNANPDIMDRLRIMSQGSEDRPCSDIDAFDYIYGILHAPRYRSDYAEFLKRDFPHIPWPLSAEEFWSIARKGAELRKLHLMDASAIGATPYTFSGTGDDVITVPKFEGGKIWINDSQYFDAVPASAWSTSVGGYQPAQKWLKDRRGSALSFEDIIHYQRVLKILAETTRIMDTI